MGLFIRGCKYYLSLEEVLAAACPPQGQVQIRSEAARWAAVSGGKKSRAYKTGDEGATTRKEGTLNSVIDRLRAPSQTKEKRSRRKDDKKRLLEILKKKRSDGEQQVNVPSLQEGRGDSGVGMVAARLKREG